MFKHLTIAILLAFTAGIASAGKMTLLEEAAEFETLSVRVSSDGTGDVRLRSCDECDELQLKLAPTTTLRVGGKALPLSTLNRQTLRSGTVFFRSEDYVITRIESAR